MLFRPEEVHASSTGGAVLGWSAHFAVGVTHYPFRAGGKHLLILHLNGNGFTAVQAWGIDTDRLSGEQPADRQRLEASLGEPFLFAVHGDAVLGRQVVERGQGYNIVGPGVDPRGVSGGDQVV